MSFPEYKGKNVGFAKVMAEVPVSDGTLAYEILNYTATEEGFLENKFRLMPLVPYESQASERATVCFSNAVHVVRWRVSRAFVFNERRRVQISSIKQNEHN